VAFTDGAGDVRRRAPSLTIPEEGTLVLHYRIVLHRGDENDAKLAERYDQYIAK
jgi:hypothetical protein